MDIMQQLGLCGIVPVAVIENAENAAPTAAAMARGFEADPASFKFKNGVQTVAYLKTSFGGFDVHLVKG